MQAWQAGMDRQGTQDGRKSNVGKAGQTWQSNAIQAAQGKAKQAWQGIARHAQQGKAGKTTQGR
jgi:hypothetical protein